MNVERARVFLLSLPHVVETLQWGDNLVFWAGDKSIGGKMFALVNLSADANGVISFAAGPDRFAELVEVEGFRPAPYLARAHWVAASGWDVLRPAEWQAELRAAHRIVFAKLPKRTRDVLAMPVKQREQTIAERKKKLAAQAKTR
jgi:predicted DNA-binding protein (MmcQ/YjbR family)